MNNCNETVPRHFLCPVQQIGELVTFYLLDLRSDEDTSLHLCLWQLGKRSWRYLKAADSLSRAVTNSLMRPNLMCSGGISTFRGSRLTLLFSTENSVRCGQSFL